MRQFASNRTSEELLKTTLTEHEPFLALVSVAFDFEEASPFTGVHSPFTWWYSANAPDANTSPVLETEER